MLKLNIIVILIIISCSSAFAQDKEDPTKNVLDKVLDAVKRIDDLRSLDRELNELRYSSMKENIALRADFQDKIMTLRAEKDSELRKGEASRLDAIRLVDTTNLSVDRERAAATAQALQKKGDDSALVLSAAVVKSADDVRNIVKTTADEQARNLATQLGGIQAQFTDIGKRLTLLEQTGAEGLGKQKFQDPATAIMLAKLEAVITAQANSAGAGVGSDKILYGLGIVLALILSAFGLFRPKTARRP